jgi:hypothetical protein
MTELNRFALFGRGEKLSEIVGDALFYEMGKRIHGDLDQLISIGANSVISTIQQRFRAALPSFSIRSQSVIQPSAVL